MKKFRFWWFYRLPLWSSLAVYEFIQLTSIAAGVVTFGVKILVESS
ncbi:MAG: hypothetical protein K2L30_09790 [Duncaniella sp.]|nr:hypothetical protein [Duncaniella sp.]